VAEDWFVRLTLSLKALILASLALVVLRRWKKETRLSSGDAAQDNGCTTSKERLISRWEHEAVLETVQARLDQHPEKMTIRRQTAEHPFGTIKCWMGATDAPGCVWSGQGAGSVQIGAPRSVSKLRLSLASPPVRWKAIGKPPKSVFK
jgi:hypothetical protein